MRAVLLPQKRTVELAGRHRVSDLLAALQITPGTVMVIRNDMLLTEDEIVGADEEVEIRSVISGGAPDHPKDPRSR